MESQNKPSIPTLKESSQKPQLKIRGLAAGGLSLVERLKQFKKKDLAFILAGLGVLFTAPLAEHFLLGPSEQTGAFKEGWGFRDGAGSFGKGGSPFEPGLTGLAPGGHLGGGGDIITPLNVRDPASLVMGPGATQLPPATAAPSLAPTKPETDWKDALSQAGARGAAEATKKASLPVPKVPLTGSGLRGLGAVSGGSGASFAAGPISAANVPNRPGAAQSGLSNVRAASGFKGAAGARGPGTGAGGLEQLKAAAAAAGSDFNRAAPAGANLEAAASRQMPTGGSDGGGGQGQGREDKAAAQSSSKDSKSTGDSLEFLRRKEEQQRAIDLKWKLREKAAMRWPNLQDKILEEIVMTPIKAFTKNFTDQAMKVGNNRDQTIICDRVGGGRIDATPYPRCDGGAGKSEEKSDWCLLGSNLVVRNSPTTIIGANCGPLSGGSPRMIPTSTPECVPRFRIWRNRRAVNSGAMD